MSHLYSAACIKKLLNAFQKAGFSTDDVAKLGQLANLGRLKVCVNSSIMCLNYNTTPNKSHSYSSRKILLGSKKDLLRKLASKKVANALVSDYFLIHSG